jgi:ribosomal protein L40E
MTAVQAPSISFSPLTGTVEPGKPANLVIHVTGPGSVPVPGANVVLFCTGGGALSPASGTTDASGTFQSTFIAPAEGSYRVNVTVIKEGFPMGSQSMPVTVGSGGGLPLGLVFPAILLLVIAAVVAAFLWTRNNLQLILNQREVPADGKSTIPIRIQFANGFGQLKRQRFDRQVTLDATSGTIGSVGFPEGKAFADTTLTSSRECGKVKLIAKYGAQKAEGTVDFQCPGSTVEVVSTPMEIPADGKSAATLVIRVRDKSGNLLSFLDEKTVNLSTTLGTITSPVRVPPRSQDIRATLTSGQVSGSATVTATLDQMKGEATVKFTSLAKRFCMHCGAPMGLDAAKCPSCNRAPPAGGGVDTKTCPACRAIMPVSALFCEWCGARQAR